MRALCCPLLVACILSVACGGQGERRRGRDGRIALDQEVTVNPKPQDAAFKDFPKTWRELISTSAELALPVLHAEPKPKDEPWAPIVIAQCVFSADAGGLVPQVTLTWNDTITRDQTPQAQAQRQADAGRLRFDLALHHNGFGRNYYSTILAGETLQRFKLPSNSGLVKDQEAVLLTGPGLFPKLMDYRAETVQEPDTNQQFGKHTLVLRDLSQGLTYTIRVDRPTGNGWSEERRTVFLTPVCPDSF